MKRSASSTRLNLETIERLELHHEQDYLQNEAVSRGLVLQMAREHLNRLDSSKATSKAVKVVVVVAKRQAVDVDVGGASPTSALKQTMADISLTYEDCRVGPAWQLKESAWSHANSSRSNWLGYSRSPWV
jgi:hypothetical protein